MLWKRIWHIAMAAALGAAVRNSGVRRSQISRRGQSAASPRRSSLLLGGIAGQSASTSLLTFNGSARREPPSCVQKAVCIEYFANRLGNNLLDVEYALWTAAASNFCYVALPDERGELESLLDLGDGVVPAAPGADALPRSSIQCGANISLGFTKDVPDALTARRLMQEYVAPMVDCSAEVVPHGSEQLGQDGLVIHMRSGDIMDPGITQSGHYAQPPCSFYQDIILHGHSSKRFASVLIVTEADRRNPCVSVLQAMFPSKVTVQSGSLRGDACTVMAAENLVLSFGTFGMALSRFSTNLRNLYVPFGRLNGTWYEDYIHDSDTWYLAKATYDEGMPFKQHIYTFQGYNTTWDDWADREAKMLGYSEKIRRRHIPRAHSAPV